MKEPEKPEISYRRELRQNYLMIAASEELEQRFEARMMAGNTIDGLLKFRVRREDDRLWFCYEITSRQPLSRLLERTAVTAEQVRRLFLGIAQTLAGMEDYLLSENLLLLDPELIYMDPLEFQPGLCLLPGREGDFPKEFSSFLQYLLGKTDHGDKEAVMLVYGLYQESLKDNYGLGDLLRWLMREEHLASDTVYRTEDGGTDRNAQDGFGDVWPEESDDSENMRKANSRMDNSRRKNPRTVAPWMVKYGRSGMGRLAWWLLLPVLAFAVLWMRWGMGGILRYGPAAVSAAAVISLAGISLQVIRLRREDSGRKRNIERRRTGVNRSYEPEGKRMIQEGAASWEMIFEEPEPEPEQGAREPPRPQSEDTTHTMLRRSAVPGTKLRRLAGIEGTDESIPISYYPFLIGKQESLADFILREDTISRLHARIDRRNDTYWLTDLNSTNGTVVNSHALEANETVELHIGDRVELADLHFKFE